MSDDWKLRLERMKRDLVVSGDPVAWVSEADAVQASLRFPSLAVRGALFGVAVQRRDEEGGGEWRMVTPLQDGMPQVSRDSLNSKLWFRAKDDTDDPHVRRALLAAVAVLEREAVDEVEVLDERYRIVRGDELARSGPDGLEPPRPTDVEPIERTWDDRGSGDSPDVDFVLDPFRERGLMSEALRLGLRSFEYSGKRYPAAVREDSRRAVVRHPEIALMPVTFGVVEQTGDTWRPEGSLLATPHAARRFLYSALTRLWPMLYDFGEAKRERYARIAEKYRAADRADELMVDDRLFRICRVERIVRFGPDGPEKPRPSDIDDYGPMKMHPSMDAMTGEVHHGE
ncbi:DUF5954 family protein [Streptomyces sp. NPDC093111]|uniref:DUF5954 family protein n=1 Tax=Streptomyces sp. NPDC093111 TaxID=3154978 RepID=UPI00342FCE15